MERTAFAGLTRLEAGEPLSTDDFSFQDRNPAITDVFLRLGARDHRHDAHAALEGASVEALVEVDDAGGTIPADTDITVGYTLVDADGGETVLAADDTTVTTQAGLATPESMPLLASSPAAGSLLAGNYSYGVTVTDGLGGETSLGPINTITIEPGSATNEIEISGLTDIVAEAGGTGWRLWRSVDGGQFGLLDDGAGDTVTDDGSFCLDCTVAPPFGTGTSNSTNQLRVAVPAAGQPADAVSFRIYAHTGGGYGTPALLGEYPVADFDDEKTYTSLTFLDGQPPDEPTAIAGANKIDALTDILNLSWKPSVLNVAALPGVDNVTGDARIARTEGVLYWWNGAAWVAIGGGGTDLEAIPLTTHITWVNLALDGVAEIWAEEASGGTGLIDDDFSSDTSADYTAPAGALPTITGGRMEGDVEEFRFFNHETALPAGDLRLRVKCDMDAGWLTDFGNVTLYFIRPTFLGGFGIRIRDDDPFVMEIIDHAAAVLDTVNAPPYIDNTGTDVFWLELVRTGDVWEANIYDTDPALGGVAGATLTYDTLAEGTDGDSGSTVAGLWAISANDSGPNQNYDDAFAETPGDPIRTLNLRVLPAGVTVVIDDTGLVP